MKGKERSSYVSSDGRQAGWNVACVQAGSHAHGVSAGKGRGPQTKVAGLAAKAPWSDWLERLAII